MRCARPWRLTGLAPERLRLEITENSVIGNSDGALAVLRALRRMQVGLVIDDFGTGYSSLSYLQRLPFGTLKIDRSFVGRLDEGGGSPGDRAGHSGHGAFAEHAGGRRGRGATGARCSG